MGGRLTIIIGVVLMSEVITVLIVVNREMWRIRCGKTVNYEQHKMHKHILVLAAAHPQLLNLQCTFFTTPSSSGHMIMPLNLIA